MAEFFRFYQRDTTGAEIAGSVLRLTDAEENVTHSTGTYEARKFTRSEIIKSGEISDNETTLTFSKLDEFAKSRMLKTKEPRYWVEIRQSAADMNPFWRGKMTLVRPTRNTISITFAALLGALRIYGLPVNYQRTCRHSLYDGLCKVDRAALDSMNRPLYSRAVHVLQIDRASQIVEVSDARPSAQRSSEDWPLTHLQFGTIEQGGNIYRISAVSGSMLYLSHTVGLKKRDTTATPPETGEATVYRGCDKEFPTCRDRFDNLNNFGGFPYLSPWEYWGEDLTKLAVQEAE